MTVDGTSERDAEPARILGVLGTGAGARAVDAFADLASAEAALRAGRAELLLRASGELGGGATEASGAGEASTYGPRPLAPAWVRWAAAPPR
ncbi:MAG: hypothetical protein WKG00_11580 [Polyangiaceae bacterium]